MPRMRTISEAYKEIKSKDANTSMTPYFLRRLAGGDTLNQGRAQVSCQHGHA